MRKASLLGLLALSLIVITQERANAWLNFKFGAGVNWNWQAGGNNVLWGLFRNGQPPGCGAGDPSCMPCFGGGMGMGWQQPGCCMPQQCSPCSPWMSQPYPNGAQGMGCPNLNSNTFPNNGHYYPSEFQFFGRDNNDSSRQQNMTAYNYQNWQAYPYYGSSGYGGTPGSSYGSSSYYPSYASTGYTYPSYGYNYGATSYYPSAGTTSSYYYPSTYGAAANYAYPYSSANVAYYPSYPTQNASTCYYNLYSAYNNSGR